MLAYKLCSPQSNASMSEVVKSVEMHYFFSSKTAFALAFSILTLTAPNPSTQLCLDKSTLYLPARCSNPALQRPLN